MWWSGLGCFLPPCVHLPSPYTWPPTQKKVGWIVAQIDTSILLNPFLISWWGHCLSHLGIPSGSLCMAHMLQTLFWLCLGIFGGLNKICPSTNGSLFPGRMAGVYLPAYIWEVTVLPLLESATAKSLIPHLWACHFMPIFAFSVDVFMVFAYLSSLQMDDLSYHPPHSHKLICSSPLSMELCQGLMDCVLLNNFYFHELLKLHCIPSCLHAILPHFYWSVNTFLWFKIIISSFTTT